MLIGHYLLPECLDRNTYHIFLEKVLPDLMGEDPVTTHRNIWFQHVGAPAHFSYAVREYLIGLILITGSVEADQLNGHRDLPT